MSDDDFGMDTVRMLKIIFASQDLERATADMCALAGFSETDIAAGLDDVDIIPAAVADTEWETPYRRAQFVMMDAMSKSNKPAIEGLMIRLEDACGRLVEAIEMKV